MTVPGLVNTNTKTGTPYDTAVPFIGSQLPGWVGSAFDKNRVASYDLYDSIYRNVTGTFQLVARGTENNPIYIPSGRTIVESCNRFLAVDFDYQLSGGTAGDRAAAKTALDACFRANKFWSKFVTQKRYGLIRGDAMWHIIADPGIVAPEKRIQLLELDPRTYFPITDINNVDVVEGCFIIQRMSDPAEPSRKIVKRQTYMFNDDGTVQSSMNYFKEDAWDTRIDPVSLKPYHLNALPLAPVYREYMAVIVDEDENTKEVPAVENVRGEDPFSITLDARITSLPVYHIRNMRAPNDPFGVSEMSGIERIIAGVNQAITDEELSLALDGLGLYMTNSGPPTDDAGNPTNWVLGPGRVVEVEGEADFKRVSGVSSVAPTQEHLNWLVKSMRENSGTANIAIGVVEGKTNLSGVALALQLAPLLAKNAEKEDEMMGEYDEMFNDLLGKWFPSYDVYTPGPNLVVSPMVGDPMPVDRTAVLAEVTGLVAENIITIVEAQSILSEKLGYEFKFSSEDDFLKQGKYLAATRDPFGARLYDELANPGDATNDGTTATPPSKVLPAAGGPAAGGSAA